MLRKEGALWNTAKELQEKRRSKYQRSAFEEEKISFLESLIDRPSEEIDFRQSY